jgi:arylformamidase
MRIYDVSMIIHGNMQVYKNKPEKKPVIKIQSTFPESSVHESTLSMNLHTGTHMDFSKHVTEGGKTSKTLDLNRLITKVKVLDLTHVKDGIGPEDLSSKGISTGDFVLFKTTNSFSDNFVPSFVYLSEEGARHLARIGVKGVGTDALGIERDQPGYPTHKTCFNNDIVIIEGLRLKNVPEGTFTMVALPLKIEDVEALPLSIVLLDNA